MEHSISKRLFWIFLNFALVALGIVLLVTIEPITKYADSLFSPRSLQVSGEGKVTVSPDVAVFSYSVVSEGTDPTALQEDNVKKMNASLVILKEKGVDEKDIKTTQYGLSPRYEYDEARKKTFLSGYTLTQTVQVKVRKLADVAQFLGALPEVGINQIGGVSFQVDDPEKYLKEARTEAFEKARAKAQEMAAAGGVRLGKVINVSEYGNPAPYYRDGVMGMGGSEMSSMKAVAVPQIQSGSQEITVNVSINYELR